MTKLSILPDSASYAVKDGVEVIAIKLDGGAARYRKDIFDSTSTVNVQWTVDREGFHYLRAFYRAITAKGATPFTIDLILDDPLPQEHTAYFVPGSMSLGNQRGLSYIVSAQLEVEPLDIDELAEADYVFAINEFGSEAALSLADDRLNTLVNTLLPNDLEFEVVLPP